MMRRRNREVIVIDDDRSFLPAIVRLINAGGYPATGLSSLADLRGGFPTHKVGCVLTDIVLAGESGLDAPEILRKSGFSGPVLFMTATDDQTLIDAAALLSHVPCLRKPIEADTLFDALERAFDINETPEVVSE